MKPAKETEFEEEEIEYYEEDEESEEQSKRAHENLMREEKRKLRALLDQNFPLPKVVLIKDEFGNE